MVILCYSLYLLRRKFVDAATDTAKRRCQAGILRGVKSKFDEEEQCQEKKPCRSKGGRLPTVRLKKPAANQAWPSRSPSRIPPSPMYVSPLSSPGAPEVENCHQRIYMLARDEGNLPSQGNFPSQGKFPKHLRIGNAQEFKGRPPSQGDASKLRR